ncbi:MAG: hypothetical protein U0236_21715 [Nitrospira sp.]
MVFDHHIESDSVCAGRSKQSVIESVGATTTLLVEQLRRRHFPVTPFEATVMALGLCEETGSFTFSSTASRDFEAGAFLVEVGADLNMVTDILYTPLDPGHRRAAERFIGTLRSPVPGRPQGSRVDQHDRSLSRRSSRCRAHAGRIARGRCRHRRCDDG